MKNAFYVFAAIAIFVVGGVVIIDTKVSNLAVGGLFFWVALLYADKIKTDADS